MVVAEEEVIEKNIGELEEKVGKNQGEVILTFRRIYLGTEKESGDMIPPHSYHGDYFETGVINGKLERREKTEESGMLSFWTLSSNHPVSYYFTPNIFVPVENKMSWDFSKNDLSKGDISFIPRNLRDAKKGHIKLGSLEFLSRDVYFNPEIDVPELQRLEVLIGDGEIQEFAKPLIEYGSFTKENVDDFLYLMKTPGEVEKRVEAGYSKERERLGEGLVESVNDLARIRNDISKVGERVLKLHLCRSLREQDGSSYVYWSDSSLFESYSNLKARANSKMEEVSLLLKKADEISLNKHPFIKGEGIGFPAEIRPDGYLTYVSEELIPSFTSVVGKLEGHLREARKVEV